MTSPKILAWLSSGDTGLSSRAIVAHMDQELAIAAQDHYRYSHPRDPADLGRCIRLMDIMPGYRERIGEMAEYGEEWTALVEHWPELEALYRVEAPSGIAPKTYARMRELLDPIWERQAAEMTTRFEAQKREAK